MDNEPRFLLDEDSICYGCKLYVHIDDADDDYAEDEIDKNGGVCDTYYPCHNGDMNEFEATMHRGALPVL